MLIKYLDGTASWRCERCGTYHGSRFVLLPPGRPCPPWGWSGGDTYTYCDRCVHTMRTDAKASMRDAAAPVFGGGS